MHLLTKWLNQWVKLVFLTLFLTALSCQLLAQTKQLTLQQAYEKAKQNYPLIQQKQLIEQTGFLSVQNIRTALLPQVSFNGQATYQSDVTSLPISLPGVVIHPLSKDQYKFWTDVNQLVYDGGLNKQQQALQQTIQKIDLQKNEVELYKLHDRINQLYLGTLLLQTQIQQTQLYQSDVATALKTVEAQVANGTAFKTAQLVLQAQLLQTQQKLIELDANKGALLQVLSLFVQDSLSSNVQLQMPTPQLADTISRPELSVYALQDSMLQLQNGLLHAKLMPKANLFVQSGYGKPALNLLKNQFDWYYMGGLRFNWSLSNLYTYKRDKQINKVQQQINDVQKNTFLFNTQTQVFQQKAEIAKLQKLLATDVALTDIKKKIKETAKAQLDNGVITANDYLKELNAFDEVMLNQIIHQILLVQAQIQLQTISGNI